MAWVGSRAFFRAVENARLRTPLDAGFFLQVRWRRMVGRCYRSGMSDRPAARENGCDRQMKSNSPWQRAGSSSSRARLFIFSLCIVFPVVARAASLSPEEAADHVGETTTVCGAVASASYLPQAPQSPTFLDLGRPFPNQIFSAIIFGADRAKFGTPETSMRDKSICVKGTIFLYQGKPKMILRDPKQLSGG